MLYSICVVSLVASSILVVGTSCKVRKSTSNNPSVSTLQGTISQSPPGGTLSLRDFSSFDCSAFKEAVWFRLSKPVGAMIWHQYIGLRISFKDKGNRDEGQLRHEFETSGLSDPSDLNNLKAWWSAPGDKNDAAHLLASKRYRNCEPFLASVKRMNEAMASSRYQYAGVRIISMVIAPVPVLGGRPCAREANAGTQTWLSAKIPEERSETCDRSTVEIPEAIWTENSVDWDDTAFGDAEDSFHK